MGLETGTYIDSLVPSNPTGADPRAQGDDHIRLIKSTLKNTFPNINGLVSATDEDLNAVPGMITGKADITYVDSENDAQNAEFEAELALKAPLDSPDLTGVPTAPTAAAGTSTTQLATTEFAMAAGVSGAIGVDQTWQNVTGSRVSGTTYTNDTGKPIEVKVRTGAVNSGNITLTVGGVDVDRSSNANDNDTLRVSAIVPVGATYVCTSSSNINTWVELR